MTDRTLADELGSWRVDLTRVTKIGNDLLIKLGWLHDKGRVHPSVTPAAIAIAGNFDEAMLGDPDVAVARAAPWAAPETIRDGTLTVASNLYSVAAIVKALLDGRDHPVVDSWLDPDASRRPKSWEDMQTRLFAIGWTARTVGRVTSYRRAYAGSDATETALLSTLRANPNDTPTREVYADWLEGHGSPERAAYLRGNNRGAPGDVPWRALFARSAIIGCYRRDGCPGAWPALAPTRFDNVRTCTTCRREVTYGTSALDAELAGVRDDVFVSDPALDFEQARRLHMQNSPVRDATWNPPPPPPLPDIGPPGNPPLRRDYGTDTTVLGRFFGWFRRKRDD